MSSVSTQILVVINIILCNLSYLVTCDIYKLLVVFTSLVTIEIKVVKRYQSVKRVSDHVDVDDVTPKRSTVKLVRSNNVLQEPLPLPLNLKGEWSYFW